MRRYLLIAAVIFIWALCSLPASAADVMLGGTTVFRLEKSEDAAIISQRIENLLQDVVVNASKIMEEKYKEYNDRTDPYIYSELERLEALKAKHKDAQLSIFDLLGQQRKKSEKEREIDEMFNAFYTWERDSIEIKNNPYIQIIAVVTGVN